MSEGGPNKSDLDALKDGAALLIQAGNRVAALSLLWSAVAIDPTGAAINCAIVRLRGFDFRSCPALKSCISASDVTAIVPVNPLDDMFTGTLPGEMKAKTACIMFDMALMGPQFVSPNTRRPTSISGSDKTIAMNER